MIYNNSKPKTSRQMERHFKGISNHHRISILLLVDSNGDLGVEDIAGRLDANFKTISQHTRYLVQAGLLEKRYKGRMVVNSLSPYGKLFAQFIKKFQTSNI